MWNWLQLILALFGRKPTFPEETKPAPAAPQRFNNIVATEFGGTGDEQPSAYADVKPGWPGRPGVALPYRWSHGPRPRVRVWLRGRFVDCDIMDVGPWNTQDPYWLVDGKRPQAESGTDTRGRKTNKAGIDLTPAAAKAIGLSGKDMVTWEFIPAAVTVPMQQQAPVTPRWMIEATKDLGFHETGKNQGIGKFIKDAHCGSLGDPWCAISTNAWLERAGVPGTRSPSSQSFRYSPAFVKLDGPALGAIAVYWRGSPTSGLGHVGLYVGETAAQVLTLGGNESDAVRKQFEPKSRLVGYFWPKSVPLPKVGAIKVKDAEGHPVGSVI